MVLDDYPFIDKYLPVLDQEAKNNSVVNMDGKIYMYLIPK